MHTVCFKASPESTTIWVLSERPGKVSHTARIGAEPRSRLAAGPGFFSAEEVHRPAGVHFRSGDSVSADCYTEYTYYIAVRWVIALYQGVEETARTARTVLDRMVKRTDPSVERLARCDGIRTPHSK